MHSVLTCLVRQLDKKEFEVELVPHWTQRFLIGFQFPQFLCSREDHAAASCFIFELPGEDTGIKYQISKVLLVQLDVKEETWMNSAQFWQVLIGNNSCFYYCYWLFVPGCKIKPKKGED